MSSPSGNSGSSRSPSPPRRGGGTQVTTIMPPPLKSKESRKKKVKPPRFQKQDPSNKIRVEVATPRRLLKRFGGFLKSTLKRVNKPKIKKKKKDVQISRGSVDTSLVRNWSEISILHDHVSTTNLFTRKTRLHSIINHFKDFSGVKELMQELRRRREEYLERMEELMKTKRVNSTPEHPYVAIMKKIEAMGEGSMYHIDCK
jgi:hypothetical protein